MTNLTDAQRTRVAALVASTGLFDDTLRRVAAWAEENAKQLALLSAAYDHHTRRHPPGMPPGAVTWPTRRRRHRRPR